MKRALVLLGMVLSAAVAFAQGNQAFPQKEIWASDYGTWQVKSTAPNTYQWQPSSLCQFPIPNAPGNFNAFNQNGPVYIQDSDTTKSEVLAPNFVILNGNLCEVALTTVHTHDSFALMSGTAGLQEALNTIPANIPYAVQVILDRNWYTALHSTPGQVAATVIGSVKGSTAAILADWTQAPTQFYRWNGSQYVAVGSGGVSGLTAQHIPVATSATALVDSAMTDDGTTLTYPHSGGFVVPKVIFGGSVASGNYGIIGFGSPIGAYPYIQFFSTTSGGTTIDSTGVYSQALHAGTGNVSGGSLLISGIATVSTLQNGTPGVPIILNQNGGNAVALQITAGLEVDGALKLSNGYGSSGDVATSSGSGSPAHWVPSGGSGGTVLTPLQYGARGDGLSIANGCTTNGTTTIVCAAGPFVSGDAATGKFLCVTGAGAAGVGFCSTISTFVSSTTVTVAAAPPTNVTAAQAVEGHDDVVALQSCFNASASGNVPCVLGVPINFNTANGYLIKSAGLLIPTKANIQGSASNQGTTILSEFNGDAFSLPTSTASLQAGQPVEAFTLSNITVFHDPSWPNGRSFHINAAPGVYGFGGLFNSTISDVNSIGAALECLWLDGHTFSDDNPNQYITFNQFKCNGPNQSHPANEIKITGIQAQILFQNGSIDGTSSAFYPNPLIYVGEKTSGQADSPGAVTFFGFTYESGTQGLYIGNGSTNIHFDNGYIESVGTPLILEGTVQQFTYRGNHVANSGNVTAVVSAIGHANKPISGTVQDTLVYGSTADAAFAVCSGGTNNFNIDFLNNEPTIQSTSNCATNHTGSGAALLQPLGITSTVDASSTVITTIRDPNVQPGKTLTLKALSGGVGSFSLGTGGTPTGNDYPIDLGAYASPLVVPAGNSVVLALLDASGAPVYTVVGGSGFPFTPNPARKGTFVCTAGGTITIANAFELATSDVVISLNAQGGTISTAPAMKAVTGGTGFTVVCGAADTSTYNYDILN